MGRRWRIRHGFALAAMAAPCRQPGGISVAALTPRRNPSGERDITRDIARDITMVGDGDRRTVRVPAAPVRLHRSEKDGAWKAWKAGVLRGAPSRHTARSTAGDDCAGTPQDGGRAPHGTGGNPGPVHPHRPVRVRSRRNGSRTIVRQLRRPLGWASTPAPYASGVPRPPCGTRSLTMSGVHLSRNRCIAIQNAFKIDTQRSPWTGILSEAPAPTTNGRQRPGGGSDGYLLIRDTDTH